MSPLGVEEAQPMTKIHKTQTKQNKTHKSAKINTHIHKLIHKPKTQHEPIDNRPHINTQPTPPTMNIYKTENTTNNKT